MAFHLDDALDVRADSTSTPYWLCFFQNGEQLDADSLPGPLTRPEICQAMEVLKVFSQSDVERDRYENRMKALRDQRTFLRARDDAVNELRTLADQLEQKVSSE